MLEQVRRPVLHVQLVRMHRLRDMEYVQIVLLAIILDQQRQLVVQSVQ